jgi:hypothetical protein
MTAAFIIGAWLLLCLILLAANQAFKLSCQRQCDASPDDGTDKTGIGDGYAFTHRECK